MKNTLRFFNLYFLFTVFYYCTGKWAWNIPSYIKLLGYLLICYLMLNIGYHFVPVGNARYKRTLERPKRYKTVEYRDIRRVFWVSAISLIIFQVAWVVVLFGSFSISNVFSMIGTNYYQRLSTTFESKVPIMQVRTLLWGLTLFCYPIGFIYFKRMPRLDKCLFIVAILVDVLTSLNMGISKNIGDIVVIFIAIILLNRVSGRHVKGKTKNSTWRIVAIVIVFLIAFSQIQSARSNYYAGAINPYGSFATIRQFTWQKFVFGENSTICRLYESVGGYVSNAYTGLAYALELPFRNTWLLGFSRALLGYVDQYLHINLSNITYNARIDQLYGWHDGQWWPTAFTWIANSVSFWLVPLVMLLFGVFIRFLEDEYIRNGDIVVATVYCQVIITLFYLPCNMQVFQSRASLFGSLLLLSLLILGRKKRKNAPELIQEH